MKKKYYAMLVCIIIAVALFESFNPYRIQGLGVLRKEVDRFQYFPSSMLEAKFESSKTDAFLQWTFTDNVEIEPKEIVAFYEKEFEKNGWIRVVERPKSLSIRSVHIGSHMYKKDNAYCRVIFQFDYKTPGKIRYYLQVVKEISLFGKEG